MASTAHRTAGATRPRRTFSVASLGMVALMLTGCGTSGAGPAAKPPGAPVPTRSSSVPSAVVKQQVLAAYQGMFDAEVKALNTDTLAGSQLEAYAFDKQLANIKGAVFQDIESNVVMTGRPAYTVQSIAVDTAATPHTATVTLCFDNKNWTPIDKTTRKSVSSPGQVQRYVSTARLRTVGSRWVVIGGTTNRGRQC